MTTVGLRRYSAALWKWINRSDFVSEPTCTYTDNWEHRTCHVPSRGVFHTASTI